MAATPEGLATALADRYRLERELGAGGMATVYLAEDLKHHRQVAIKVLRPDLAASLGAERFLREVGIAARLSHPHILGLFDSGETAGFLYYVMPYVEGISLRQKLQREGELPIPEAVRILRDVADAMAYAHGHGIVHRDIKPENVMLTAHHALVMDFGVAKALAEGQESGRSALTSAGVALGTPAYMAPEQATGDDNVDARADIYAWGVIAYELLAGQPPFVRATSQSTLAAQVTAVPVPLGQHRPDLPEALAPLVMSCLAKRPADRPQTAENVFRQLGEVLTPTGTRSAARPLLGLMRPSARPLRRRLIVWGVAVMIIVASLARTVIGRSPPGSARPAVAYARTAIAVLPFRNLSPDEANSYFAAGLHDELLTQLAKVATLSVRGRTSVQGYRDTSISFRELAAELAVGSVLEGSVQVVGQRLAVNVYLIDARTGEQLWAERYAGTLDDAFAIQSDVTQKIVAAVGGTLGVSEQALLARAPTATAEAYRLYMQGRQYWWRPGWERENMATAQQLYERALRVDPDFALAHAAMSQIHALMYWVRYEPSAARANAAITEAETSLRLAPDLPQAHMAMGNAYYYIRMDYQRALDEFAIALRGLPNSAELWTWIGWVNRRLGNWDQVFDAFAKAVQLEPRDPNLFYSLAGDSYRVTHRYARAVEAYDRALTLQPDFHGAAIRKGQVYLLWQGNLDTLRAVLNRVPRDERQYVDIGTGTVQRLQFLLLTRQPDSLLAQVGSTRARAFHSQDLYLPTSLFAAWAHQLRGDEPAARSMFAAAQVFMDSVLRILPDDWRVHAARGLALAGASRSEEALREARWLQQSVVYRQDAYLGPLVAEERARVLAQAGDPGAALDEIERLLANPSWLSVHTLRLDPRWDALREHPRFKALLAKYSEH